MNRNLFLKHELKISRDLDKLEAIHKILMAMESHTYQDHKKAMFDALEVYTNHVKADIKKYQKYLSMDSYYKEIEITFNDTDLTVQYDDDYQIEAIYVGTEDITQLLSHDEVEKLIEQIIEEEKK